MARVTWKGVTVDDRTARMLTAVDRAELPTTSFQPTQGSYSTGVSASAGTHSGGGAVDIALAGLDDDTARRIETAMRRVGFAAWYRTAIPGTWPRHVHGIAVGCSDLASAARSQVTAYLNGRDGLAGNGPDTGTRSYVDVTWESYFAAHPYVLEDIMASLADVEAVIARYSDSVVDRTAAKVLNIVRAEGISGAAVWTEGQYPSGTWTVGSQAAALMARETGKVIDAAGVAGAGDPAHNGVGDLRADVDALPDKVAGKVTQALAQKNA